MKSPDRDKLSKLLLKGLFIVVIGWSGSAMSESLKVTVNGLVGSGLKLNIDGNERSVTNGTFTVDSKAMITIAAQPTMPAQNCKVIKAGKRDQVMVSCMQSLYTLDSRGIIRYYQIDPKNNNLLHSDGYLPFNDGMMNYSSMAVDPLGRFVYVQYCRESRGCVIASLAVDFNRDTWDQLLRISHAPIKDLNLNSPITLDPKGRFMYLLRNDGTLGGYTINSEDGTLKGEMAIKETRRFSSIAIDSKGEYVYTIGPNRFGSTSGELDEQGKSIPFHVILGYKIDSQSGVPTNANDRPDALYPGEQLYHCSHGKCKVLADPLGRFVYVINEYGNIEVFKTIENGKLEKITSDLMPDSTPPKDYQNVASVVADPTGKFIFMAKPEAGGIFSYSINEKEKKVEEAGRIKVPLADFMGVDFTGKFIYVPRSDKNAIDIYAIDDVGKLSLKGVVEPVGFAHNLAITP
jgi:6-phosphogluconolactonase (cycloisomerase 2 family)